MARVAVRLGVPATAAVLAGGDTGRALAAELAAEGVDVVAGEIAEATRESLTVDELRTGRQFRFLLPGPAVSADEIDRFAGIVERLAAHHRHVILSGSMPVGVDGFCLQGLIKRLRGHKAEVLVDTSGAALLHAARAGVMVLKPSVNELALAMGRSMSTHGELVAGARQLLALGDNRAVLVSMGAEGALLVERDQPDFRIAAPAVRSVSVIGAGDSLVAGFVVALERGLSLSEAVRFGVATGSATVIRKGSALCEADDVERLYAAMVSR